MKVEIIVFGKKSGCDDELFSLNFMLPGTHNVNDIHDLHYIYSLVKAEISNRLSYDFVILDLEVHTKVNLLDNHEKL